MTETELMRAHTLEQVSERIRRDTNGAFAPTVRWLQERASKGKIPASKIGGKWLMTEADICGMFEACRPSPKPQPGLTPTSRRRLS